MRACGIAVSRGGIAVVAAKFLLNLDRAHCGVHLNLLMEAVVIGLAEILDKIARPRTAEAPRRIEPGIEAQHFAGADLQQGTIGLQSFEFGFILNTRQLQAVDLSVLDDERFVRRSEHRVPEKPTKMPAVGVLGDSVVHRKSSPRQSPACEGQQDRSHELELNDAFHEVANGGGHHSPAKPLSPVGAGASSGYSMPCCQVVQPDTTRRAVTRLPNAR